MLRVLKMSSPSGQRYGGAMTKSWHGMTRRVRNPRDYERWSAVRLRKAGLMDTLLQQTTSNPSNRPSTAPSLLSAGSALMAFASLYSSGSPNDRYSGYRGVGCRAMWNGYLRSQEHRLGV